MESCPTQAVLPLVGLAAEKVIPDQYNVIRDQYKVLPIFRDSRGATRDLAPGQAGLVRDPMQTPRSGTRRSHAADARPAISWCKTPAFFPAMGKPKGWTSFRLAPRMEQATFLVPDISAIMTQVFSYSVSGPIPTIFEFHGSQSRERSTVQCLPAPLT
ncbi:MAG: hypothetical protein ACQESR_29765 [Planctomycetota bacterium]